MQATNASLRFWWRLKRTPIRHAKRRWTRGFFSKTNQQLLDLTSALCLPSSASTVLENDSNLAAIGDCLIRSRWSSLNHDNTKHKPSLIQNGQLKQQVMIWESELLMDDSTSSTEMYLVKTRLLHQLYMELGEYEEAIQSLMRSGLINSGKARDPTHVGCAFGMASFAMQQQGFFSQAEELASRALGISSGDLWAIISVVEAYQQQGRAREGLRFLRETETEWKESVLEPILLGRRAFLHLELGDQDQCLRVMEEIHSHMLPLLKEDNQTSHRPRLLWDHWMMADLASLSHSISMAERYFELNAESLLSNQNEWPERSKMTAFDGTFSTLMKLSCNWTVKEEHLTSKLLSNVDFVEQTAEQTIRDQEDAYFYAHHDIDFNKNNVVEAVEAWGVPLIQALIGSYQTDPSAKQVKDLLRMRRRLHQIGGLASMRDALAQTAFLTALRWAKSSRDPKAFNVARALSLERLSQRPGSPQVWFWHSQLCAEMGDMATAQNAKTRAVDLGLGQGGQFGD